MRAGAEVAAAGVVRTFAMPGAAPVEVLRGVTLHVEAGGSLAVTGPSGSGKTTLLQLIGGLDRPDAGEVRVGGRDVGRMDEAARASFRNREVGFVFQNHHLLPQLTALENVLVPGWAGRVDEVLVRRGRDLLARVGLREREGHFPGQLSGGERQRVAVARALLLSPGLVLADEPTGALDGEAARALVGLLAEMNAEAGVTLIVVTHAEACAARMAHRVRLERGVIST